MACPEGGERTAWHATVAFTLDTCTSALPAMDKSVADVVAGRIPGTDMGNR